MRNYLTHIMNPLHIFCRLRDVGFSKSSARKIAAYIEKIIIVHNGNLAVYRA